MKRCLENKTCSICLEEQIDESTWVVLDCGHSFHEKCIEECQKICAAICPLCRTKFPRTIELIIEDKQHWKAFSYGSEIFIQWISEFETFQTALQHIVINTDDKILLFETPHYHVAYNHLTDLWWSTKQVAVFISQWLQKEYPVFITCENTIYKMLSEHKTICNLQLQCSQFMFIFDGCSVYYSLPNKNLVRFVIKEYQSRFAIRQEQCWRMIGPNRYREYFQSLVELQSKITSILSKIKHCCEIPPNLNLLIEFLTKNSEMDDYVLGSKKYPDPTFREVDIVLGCLLEKPQNDEWVWNTCDEEDVTCWDG